jgi:hypothetical protein
MHLRKDFRNMLNVQQNRRRLLRRAGFLGGGAALVSPLVALASQALTSAQAKEKTQGPQKNTKGPQGSWRIKATTHGSDAPPPFEALHTFAADQTTVTAEQFDQIPTKQGTQWPTLASPGHGVWSMASSDDGPDDFVYKYEKLLVDTKGNLVGILRINIKAQLTENGQAFEGKGTAVVIPPSGKTPPDFSISLSATRI